MKNKICDGCGEPIRFEDTTVITRNHTFHFGGCEDSLFKLEDRFMQFLSGHSVGQKKPAELLEFIQQELDNQKKEFEKRLLDLANQLKFDSTIEASLRSASETSQPPINN